MFWDIFKKKKDIEIPKYHQESQNFLDDEYQRTYNAKKSFLNRIPLDKKHEICENMEIDNFLMDDHSKQYEGI